MTILNLTPLKGLALDPITNKMTKADLYFAIHGNGEFVAIADFEFGGRGTGGLCIVELRENPLETIGGYLCDIKQVKPYKYELNKHKRGL